MEIRLLTGDDIRQCLTMGRAISLMEEAFRALSGGRVAAPLRTQLAAPRGTMLYKPAMLESAGVFCLKAVGVFPGNVEFGLPSTAGLVLINDVATGLPLAILDAQYLTALRTGAAAGLATRLLAPPGARRAALFGAGGQARCQLEALVEVAELDTVYVFARRRESAEAFCHAVAGRSGACRVVPGDDRAVLRDCEIVSTVTTSATPVFDDAELGPRVHINGMGSFTPAMAEIPPETVVRAWVCVDHREACLAEAGDVRQPIESGRLAPGYRPEELGEVLDHGPPEPRPSITLFKSVGNAAQDVVCAAELLAEAERRGIGARVAVGG